MEGTWCSTCCTELRDDKRFLTWQKCRSKTSFNRQRRLEEGKCRDCQKENPDSKSSRCPSCLARGAKRKMEQRLLLGIRNAKNSREKELCTSCKSLVDVEGFKQCRQCRQKNRLRKKLRNQKGKCSRCAGNIPDCQKYQTCSSCRERRKHSIRLALEEGRCVRCRKQNPENGIYKTCPPCRALDAQQARERRLLVKTKKEDEKESHQQTSAATP